MFSKKQFGQQDYPAATQRRFDHRTAVIDEKSAAGSIVTVATSLSKRQRDGAGMGEKQVIQALMPSQVGGMQRQAAAGNVIG